MQATLQEGKISGNDRAVAWDGQTQSGAGLANQLKAIAENRVRSFLSVLTNTLALQAAHACEAANLMQFRLLNG